MKKILSIPQFFNLFNLIIGEKRGRKIFSEEYVKPFPKMKVLDIGCGTGTILSYLGDVEYYGYDASADYINFAKTKYGDKGNFYCEMVEASNLKNREYYDVVIASGLIHHLNDKSVELLFSTAKEALAKGGRFIAIDNVLVDNQSSLAKWIIKQDRGEFIREEFAYKKLFQNVFSKVNFDIRSDILRIPYTHIIVVATK